MKEVLIIKEGEHYLQIGELLHEKEKYMTIDLGAKGFLVLDKKDIIVDDIWKVKKQLEQKEVEKTTFYKNSPPSVKKRGLLFT